ncbi:MAG: DUF4445 domain-containing protein [Nitrospirae bacterium]|nr:DUF4445 domain-containing protein [Nitrospirota bacterium]
MKVTFTDGKEITVVEGESLYEAFKRQEVYITASCGGKGTCGKCRIRIIDGDYSCRSYGKLSREERDGGIVLACQSYASGDLVVDIPVESRLSVGDKIAISRSKDLVELLRSYNAEISPLVTRTTLRLPPPTIDDNISDLERLKRELDATGLDLRYSKEFVSRMVDDLRRFDWNVNLGYQEDSSEALFLEPAEPAGTRYGIAVDIGTTTVVLYLVDMTDGHVVDVASTYNSQMRYGDDVITRIVHATEGGGLDDLRKAVTTDINDLITPILKRHGLEAGQIESVVISGNTTMIQLFWGFNPSYIREEPYIPAANSFPVWKASETGIRIGGNTPVYTVPCVASYVGGDIVSGVIATKMHRSPEISLFMDIGTNGEIVIGNDEWMMTVACSAGPCFEGSGIKHGMRATEGAIESIRIDPETLETSIEVIGESRPLGICGSGMIDAVSEMFLRGILDQRGKFVRETGGPRIREGEDGLEFVIHHDAKGDIVLTQVDVENIMRAKAAVYAGVSLLLKEVGFTFDMIEKVYIAGGFGNYLNVERAILIGMLPDIPEDRFHFMGNTSVAGAYLCLLSRQMREEAEDVASRMTYIELSVKGGFMDEFMSALFLPHTDIEQFPTVKAKLPDR